MRIVRAGLRPVVGLLILAHGLSHAAMPLRHALESPSIAKDFMPAILLGMAVTGFTIAGLGVLRVRPFTGLTRPLLVLASAYSLIGISRFGQGDLYWSATVDVVLLLTGLTGAYRYLPQARQAAGDHLHAEDFVATH